MERTHIAEAYTFELGKCFETPIRQRMLVNLANIHPDLVALVAAGLGMPAPEPTIPPAVEVVPSPSLSQVYAGPGPITGRVIGVIATPGADLAGIATLRKAGKPKALSCACSRPSAASSEGCES